MQEHQALLLTRRRLLHTALGTGVSVLTSCRANSRSTAGAPADNLFARPITLTWWAGSGTEPGFIAIKESFMQRFPNVTVQLEKEANHLKPEGLLAAVLAGMSPDATRFADVGLGDWASRGGVLVLDDTLKTSRFFRREDFHPRLLESGKWAGKFYAIPFLTDTRPFFWNKDVFRAEGLNADRSPANWDELREYTRRLTRPKGDSYERIGFIPLFGNSWLYLFGWLNGAEPVQFSPDGTKQRCIIDDGKWVQALEYLVSLYDLIGGKQRSDAWLQEMNAPGAGHVWLAGKVPMMITTDTFGATIGKFAPTLDFGFTLPPAPQGKQPLTWSGIWNMVVMKDSKHPAQAVEFIAYVTAVEGLRAWAEGTLTGFRTDPATSTAGYWYPPVATNRRGGEAIFEVARDQMPEVGKRLYQFSSNALESSRHRPVMPAGLEVWDALAGATNDALAGKLSAKEALAQYAARVNAKFQELGVLF
jgi:multiple sugar transport system substrate-binding protein